MTIFGMSPFQTHVGKTTNTHYMVKNGNRGCGHELFQAVGEVVTLDLLLTSCCTCCRSQCCADIVKHLRTMHYGVSISV